MLLDVVCSILFLPSSVRPKHLLYVTPLQVRERRKARDELKHRDSQHRQRQREAWEEAERLVREGEREEGRRRRREERLVAEQMEIIRQHVQDETESRRRQVALTHHTPVRLLYGV